MKNLAFPKPERRSKVKQRSARVWKRSRAQCRAIVLRRENSRCQRCGRIVTDDCEAYLPQRAHVHEIIPRSLGGDPTDPNGCLLLCQACHLPNGRHRHAPNMKRLLAILNRSKRIRTEAKG